MEKVKTELEALKWCEENQCEVRFHNESRGTPKHVKVRFGLIATVVGKDLIEAVNRLVEVYHTRPIDYHKLDWWLENQEFYLPPSRKTVKSKKTTS